MDEGQGDEAGGRLLLGERPSTLQAALADPYGSVALAGPAGWPLSDAEHGGELCDHSLVAGVPATGVVYAAAEAGRHERDLWWRSHVRIRYRREARASFPSMASASSSSSLVICASANPWGW
ncbi:hypothetical protein [Streptomyces sp. NPDC047928]|uniref:hypothetical protein n=1 Tax=Streptomyces sp. NPDC047928 TaxID=3365492 RepID=UPI00371FD4ED